jgi:hypothetical protein
MTYTNIIERTANLGIISANESDFGNYIYVNYSAKKMNNENFPLYQAGQKSHEIMNTETNVDIDIDHSQLKNIIRKMTVLKALRVYENKTFIRH